MGLEDKLPSGILQAAILLRQDELHCAPDVIGGAMPRCSSGTPFSALGRAGPPDRLGQPVPSRRSGAPVDADAGSRARLP